MKNDLVYELTQASHDYEKLREENPKIRKLETLINLSSIPISAVMASLIYHHFTKDIPLRQPTEEEINAIISRSGETIITPNWGGGIGGIPSKYPEIKTREGAIEFFMQGQRLERGFNRYIGYPLLTNIFITAPLVGYINPGEKMPKYSYALGKTLRNGFSRIKSYLKGMQELKQERKEVISYER